MTKQIIARTICIYHYKKFLLSGWLTKTHTYSNYNNQATAPYMVVYGTMIYEYFVNYFFQENKKSGPSVSKFREALSIDEINDLGD